MDRPKLRALADRGGILAGYHEAGSHGWCETRDETRVAILAAMGLQAETETDAEATLEALTAADRDARLPPVVVLREGDEQLPVAGPGADGSRFEAHCSSAHGDVHVWTGRLRRGERHLRLPRLARGVHRLALTLADRRHDCELRVTPRRCVAFGERLAGERAHGVWANLYSLRATEGGWGHGDLSHLRTLIAQTAGWGGDFVGLNPLHALQNRDGDISPYSPQSRLFRNPFYIALDQVPESEHDATARRLVAELHQRAKPLDDRRYIAFDEIHPLREQAYAALFAAFVRGHLDRSSERGRAFERFRKRHGRALERFAVYRVLVSEHGNDVRRWPAGYEHPEASAVARTAEDRPRDIDREIWLQFELSRQLEDSADDARRAGMGIGLYQDLAIGSAPGGFDPWYYPGLFAADATVGAPPDAFAPEGQDWGFPPIDPRALAGDGFDYWRRLLDASFEHTGALRIDHAMGLLRQWWVPKGLPASQGAYVAQPSHALLALLAEASQRHQALVVGEDLGTVPSGFAALLERYSVLSSRVLIFEREGEGRFRGSTRYSKRALVTANTHDLPSISAWWTGADLELRRSLGLIDSDAEMDEARSERASARLALVARLKREGVLDADDEARGDSLDPDTICVAVHAFLARTPSPLLGIALDDLAGESEPVNVPGVPLADYPAWSRRMHATLEAIAASPLTMAIVDRVREQRPDAAAMPDEA